MSKKDKMKFYFEVEVEFEPYETKFLNKEAYKSTKKYLKEVLKNERYVTVYLPSDEDGSNVENCFEITKVISIDKK